MDTCIAQVCHRDVLVSPSDTTRGEISPLHVKLYVLSVHRMDALLDDADGPAAAVTAAAAEIDFAHWTRATSRTSLTLLRRGGDVVDEATAAAAVRWLLATLADPAGFAARTPPTFTVASRLVDTLAGVVAAAPPAERSAVAEFVLALLRNRIS